MRIAVSGSREFVTTVGDELPAAGAGRAERVEDAKDDSDLAFSVADVATLVGEISALMPLCELLVGVFRRRSAEEPATQTLRFKTALGMTEVQISEDITAEELYAQLGTLVRE